jgi:hypothetical protein
MYALFSFLGKRTDFDLDKLLHRGKHVVAGDHAHPETVVSSENWDWKQIFGLTDDFTTGDKIIYGFAYFKTIVTFTVFLVMLAVHYLVGFSDEGWATYHYYWTVYWSIGLGLIIAVWLSIGGLRDAYRLFKDLNAAKRDFTDDGRVVDHDYEESAE